MERLPGGGLCVGVHIADVAHFIAPGSALDCAARERATSTYLVSSGLDPLLGFGRLACWKRGCLAAACARASLPACAARAPALGVGTGPRRARLQDAHVPGWKGFETIF